MAALCCRPARPLGFPPNARYPLMDPFSNGPEGKCAEREARFLSNCRRLGENAGKFCLMWEHRGQERQRGFHTKIGGCGAGNGAPA